MSNASMKTPAESTLLLEPAGEPLSPGVPHRDGMGLPASRKGTGATFFRLWREYRAERFDLRQFAPLAMLVVLVGQTGGQPGSVGTFRLQAILTLVWLLAFRLIDDLGDRSYDASHHPQRLLVRAESPAPFRALLTLTGVVSLTGAAFLLSLTAAGLLLLAAGALAVASQAVPSRLARAHVVLIKYPLFVLLLGCNSSGAPPVRLLVGALCLYFAFACYELLHDTLIRSETGADVMLLVEMCAFAGSSASLLMFGAPVTLAGRLWSIGWGLLALGGLFLLYRGRGSARIRRFSPCVFVVLLVPLLVINLEVNS